MDIKLGLFNIYTETYSKWNTFNVSKSKHETIIDIAYWRIFIS
jgi:hypothetical protein